MNSGKNPVIIAKGKHLYPYRTQKLSLSVLKILRGNSLGKIGRCRKGRVRKEEEEREYLSMMSR